MGEPTGLHDLERLARSARLRHPGAMDALIRAAHAQSYRWALVKTASEPDAEDVAQDVAYKLSRAFSSFDSRGSFPAWLYQVTANAVTDHCRRNRRHVRGRVPVEEAEHNLVVVPRPEDLDDARAAKLVREFFEILPESQREVFYLVDIQGFRPVEVSRLLGVNVNTVRANLFKARRTIRTRMLERFPEFVKSRLDDG